MASSFFGIEIARTGIAVSQQGLNVTGHNISNVDTPGYTRQRLINAAYDPYNAQSQFKTVDSAMLGAGARAIRIDQIRSVFLDRQFRSEQSLASEWNTRTTGLTYVEGLLEDTSDGSLSSSLTAFIAALNVGTSEATDREQRVAIQQTATNLAQNIRLVYTRLKELQDSQDQAIETVTNSVNRLADQIKDLNNNIKALETTGQTANDLRDRRNLLLDELSALVDIEYTESNGVVSVEIGGVDLIDASNAVTKINLVGDPAIPIWDGGGAVTLTSGELKARLDLRDSSDENEPGIPYYIDQLNTFARALVELVNGQHAAGYTYPIGGNSENGKLFFRAIGAGEDAAAVIEIHSDISGTSGIYNIAFSDKPIIMDASGTATPPTPAGDTNAANQENLRSILALFSQTDLALDGGATKIGSFENFLDGIVLSIAMTLNHSKNVTDTKNTMLAAVDRQRTSLSGVSLDEEMTNMLKFQHAYSGAARVLTAMDEALEKLINGTGRVGL